MSQAIRLDGNLAQRKPVKKISKAEAERQFKDKSEHESEYVRGIFRNYENPGAGVDFFFRSNYLSRHIQKWELQDGILYEIPRAVARHINENCRYPVHEFRTDANGNRHQHVSRHVNRFGFNSMENADISEPSSIIVESDRIVL